MAKVQFIQDNGQEKIVEGRVGDKILDVALANLIPGIIGECGGNLSCATCHVFINNQWIDLLPPKTADEEDMLEGTSEETTDESRLCCQIVLTPELDGIAIRVPRSQR